MRVQVIVIFIYAHLQVIGFEDIAMTSSFNCLLNSLSDHIVSDRRGIVTPEYRAEHERVGDDNVITNNKTYGTAKIVQPQVIEF